MTNTLVVAGALANKPGNGGEAWVRLSWVRGLMALGFDVWFIEEMAPTASALAETPAAKWFSAVADRFGLADRSVLVAGDDVQGAPDLGAVGELLAEAQLVINISGNLRRQDLLSLARCAAYIDLDPGFTQIWHATGVGDLGLDLHDLHFTVGENIGTSACPLPTGGFQWMPVRQPVVLEDWPVTPVPPAAPLTTVATWRCLFGPVTWEGIAYGLKMHEFRRIIELPGRVDSPLELALDIHPDDDTDRARLRGAGWLLRDARDVTSTPEAFRGYVDRSAGELTATQGVYARARTGWFSDRSVRYLARGRPVVVQDTGWGRDVLSGEGVLTFHDLAGAAAAVRAVVDEPERHRQAARALAERYFAAPIVLTEFLGRCGIAG